MENFDFEFVFDSFFKPIREINESVKRSTYIFPDEAQQERRINELSALPCSFGLIVDTSIERMTAVPGLSFPFKEPSLNGKAFSRLIHPSYLIPFLVFARFVYEVSLDAKIAREDIFAVNYNIPVPLKLNAETGYQWFVQTGFALSVNENNQVVRHLNLYTLERNCLPLANGEIENRLAEPSFLTENRLYPVFENYLQKAIRDYLNDVFERQYKKLKLLKLIQADSTINNRQVAVALRLSEETVKSYNKEILQKLKSILGYQFVSLREAVISLTSKGYI